MRARSETSRRAWTNQAPAVSEFFDTKWILRLGVRVRNMKRRNYIKGVIGLISSTAIAGRGSANSHQDDDECGEESRSRFQMREPRINSRFTGYDDKRDESRGFIRASGRLDADHADEVIQVTIRYFDADGEPLFADVIDGEEVELVDGAYAIRSEVDADADLIDEVYAIDGIVEAEI